MEWCGMVRDFCVVVVQRYRIVAQDGIKHNLVQLVQRQEADIPQAKGWRCGIFQLR